VHRLDRRVPGAAVLGDVGEQFGRAEVGDGLDRGRRALGQVRDHLDRKSAARAERRQRGAEPVVEHRGVNAAGQVAQLHDRLLGAAVGGVDELKRPFQVDLRRPARRSLGRSADVAAELLPGEPELHRDRHHLRLRPVVEVPFDPAQPYRRVVHGACPGLLQVTHPLRQRGAERPGGQPPVQVVGPADYPRREDQGAEAGRDQREGHGQSRHRLGDKHRVRRPPRQPSRHRHGVAVSRQLMNELPPHRERGVPHPPGDDVDQPDGAEQRDRQLEQQVSACPPADGVGQACPDPAGEAWLRPQRRRRVDGPFPLQREHPRRLRPWRQLPVRQASAGLAQPPGRPQ